MLSNITWGDFFAGVVGIVIIYYLYVLVKFYPDKLKALFSSRKQQPQSQAVFLEEKLPEEYQSPASEDNSGDYDEMDEVEKLVASLVKGIQDASEKEMVSGEFKQHLRMILREKPLLKDSLYRSSINELIISECGKQGTFTLSEMEADALWEMI